MAFHSIFPQWLVVLVSLMPIWVPTLYAVLYKCFSQTYNGPMVEATPNIDISDTKDTPPHGQGQKEAPPSVKVCSGMGLSLIHI